MQHGILVSDNLEQKLWSKPNYFIDPPEPSLCAALTIGIVSSRFFGRKGTSRGALSVE